MQGAALLAEYDNTQRGANHMHTVWRNPLTDFGGDVLRHHYEIGHRHVSGHTGSHTHDGHTHTH